MPYWLETDTHADDPAFAVLAKGKLATEDALRASMGNLKSKAALIKRDGYLTVAVALEACRGRRWVLDLLCTPVLDEPAMVHRPGDTCPCLGETWVAGFDLRIHEFLKRNPSRAENELEKEKRKDRRNAPLKAQVYDRDGGCCRYCRSGPLPAKAGKSSDRRKARQFDHVDPERPSGLDAANYVTACGRCNEGKGERTPFEADLVLLPPPTPAERSAWLARPLQLNDLPVYAPGELTHNTDANHREITTGSATDQRHVTDIENEPGTDPDRKPEPDPDVTTGPDHAQKQDSTSTDQPPGQRGNPLGSGRGGPRADDVPRPRPAPRPDLPPRDSAHPDIYTRRGRPLPPEPIYWGSNTSTSRPEEQT